MYLILQDYLRSREKKKPLKNVSPVLPITINRKSKTSGTKRTFLGSVRFSKARLFTSPSLRFTGFSGSAISIVLFSSRTNNVGFESQWFRNNATAAQLTSEPNFPMAYQAKRLGYHPLWQIINAQCSIPAYVTIIIESYRSVARAA